MPTSARFVLSLLLLVFLWTSSGVHGFSTKELVHDWNHESQQGHALYSSVLSGALEITASPSSQLFDDIEHQLLHAGSAPYFMASAGACGSWDAAAQCPMPESRFLRPLLATWKAPFRPPRSTLAQA